MLTANSSKEQLHPQLSGGTTLNTLTAYNAVDCTMGYIVPIWLKDFLKRTKNCDVERSVDSCTKKSHRVGSRVGNMTS